MSAGSSVVAMSAGSRWQIRWEGCFLQVSHSARPRLLDDRLHCLTRHQNTAIRLENPPRNNITGAQFKLWITAAEFNTLEAFIPDLASLKRFERRLAVRVILPRQPQDACGLKESRPYSCGPRVIEKSLPKRERTLGHTRVDLIRPIPHANHA
jgi:hypothetical protein